MSLVWFEAFILNLVTERLEEIPKCLKLVLNEDKKGLLQICDFNDIKRFSGVIPAFSKIFEYMKSIDFWHKRDIYRRTLSVITKNKKLLVFRRDEIDSVSLFLLVFDAFTEAFIESKETFISSTLFADKHKHLILLSVECLNNGHLLLKYQRFQMDSSLLVMLDEQYKLVECRQYSLSYELTEHCHKIKGSDNNIRASIEKQMRLIQQMCSTFHKEHTDRDIWTFIKNVQCLNDDICAGIFHYSEVVYLYLYNGKDSNSIITNFNYRIEDSVWFFTRNDNKLFLSLSGHEWFYEIV